MWAVSPRFCFGIALEGLLGRFTTLYGLCCCSNSENFQGGQKKTNGLIVGVEIKVREKEEPATVLFSEICDAKLVLTDELIIAANSANR